MDKRDNPAERPGRLEEAAAVPESAKHAEDIAVQVSLPLCVSHSPSCVCSGESPRG